MKVLFLDTNIFLQCRELKQLPWEEIAEGENLLLLIPRPVQEEIDKLKQDGNSRRAQRSRKASSFMRALVLSENSIALIRDADPKIEVTFTPLLDPKRRLVPILDLTKTDDRIIEEVIAYSEEHPDVDVALLTHDTNPLLTAKRCGLKYIVIPDNWLLAPEPDPRDKKVTELERKIQQLEKSVPMINVSAHDENGNVISLLTSSLSRYRAITDEELEQVMAQVKAKYPIISAFDESREYDKQIGKNSFDVALRSVGIERVYVPPRKEEIQEYKEVLYPKWLKGVETFIQSLPSIFEARTRHFEVDIVITNTGSRPAENVLVKIAAQGGLLLSSIPDNEQTPESLYFPSPPSAPKGKWVQRNIGFGAMLDNLNTIYGLSNGLPTRSINRDFLNTLPRSFVPEPKDRHAFYWKPRRPSDDTTFWTFECAEFRHQIEPEVFHLRITIPETTITSGALSCHLTASNLPTPASFTLPIKIEYVEKDVLEWVSKHVKPDEIVKATVQNGKIILKRE